MTKCAIKLTDFSAIAAIHNQIPEFTLENSDLFATRCENRRSLCLAATMNGEPVGYSVSYDHYEDGSLYCWMAGVLPAYRRKGVYSALAATRENWARENDFTALRIKTRNNRREMLSWLVKNGFDFTEVDKRMPIADSRIQMIKKL